MNLQHIGNIEPDSFLPSPPAPLPEDGARGAAIYCAEVAMRESGAMISCAEHAKRKSGAVISCADRPALSSFYTSFFSPSPRLRGEGVGG